tara:strand:- start:88 stop:555 length:468 start_codon:yes stop_codon:yes gene_type:complete
MSTNLTDNLNMLGPSGFKVTINSNEFANLQFFCTTATVPSISQGEVQESMQNNIAYFPGGTVEYDQFSISFIVDEEMKNYIEMFNWIKDNRIGAPKIKDITLSILSNKSTTNKQILFHDAFPVSLGELSFSTQDTSVEYITCDVTFRYNIFEFIR